MKLIVSTSNKIFVQNGMHAAKNHMAQTRHTVLVNNEQFLRQQTYSTTRTITWASKKYCGCLPINS